MKEIKKVSKGLLGVLVLSSAAVGALASCGGSSEDPEGYTYNTYLGTSPSKWNVHSWETNDESYIQSFTEAGLYDVVLNKDHNGYEFVSEMASAMPTSLDPTEFDPDYYDSLKDKYFSGKEYSVGQVWEIPLRKTAVWEDGTPIKAIDYVNSMERLLQPKYANYRADSYYNGNFVVANAENYYKNGRQVLEPVYQYITTGKMDGNYYDTDGLKIPGVQDYYIDLAAGTSTYALSIFSSEGSSEDITLYTLLNNRSTPGSDALELAAKRITIGVSYYYWKFVDHSNEDDKDKWADIKKADSVTKEMLAKQKPIRIRDFDSNEVLTCANRSDSAATARYTQKDLQNDLSTLVRELSRSTTWASSSWAWKVPLCDTITHRKQDGLSMDNVGIEAKDDYTLRLYLEKSISALDLKFQLASNWLVKTDLYDNLTRKNGSAWMTSYASGSVDNYMSYGPYKLTGFVAGQAITIERNEKWYGYTDEAYKAQFADYSDEDKDQYRMTKIYTRIIKEHSVAVSEFMAGNLDDIDLNKDDMKKYGNSSRRTTTLESYTQKLSFNTSRSKLAERQTENGKNKTILANKDFRKGLSLGLNRNNFASQATAGSQAFTGLLNNLYLANVATGEMYRDTEQGKSVYNQIYGELGGKPGDAAPSALSETAQGYNYAWAKYYMKKGILDELKSTAEKHLIPGDEISIEFRVYDNTSDTTIAMTNFISSAWSSLLQDVVTEIKSEDKTVLGDKGLTIKINSVKDEDYYTSARNGGFDMIFSIWGGAAIDPYGLMQVYLDKTFTNTCEYGFKGKQDTETLWIDLNGDGKEDAGETQSFDAWYHEMNDNLLEGEFSDEAKTDPTNEDYAAWKAVHDKRLTILAGTEAGIVNRFEAIPIVARGTSSLNGFKIENATKTYVNLVGYGGIRFLRFNYNNSAWSSFVSEQGGNLSNLYATWTD